MDQPTAHTINLKTSFWESNVTLSLHIKFQPIILKIDYVSYPIVKFSNNNNYDDDIDDTNP